MPLHPPPASKQAAAADGALRALGLSFPEAYEEFPWGHRALKVKKKVFAFMAHDEGVFSMSVKLPESNGVALALPFARPTEYGLGKAGWVSASFEPGRAIPVELLAEWLKESYVAVAPAKLGARLGEARSAKPAAGGQTERPRRVALGAAAMRAKATRGRGQSARKGSASARSVTTRRR